MSPRARSLTAQAIVLGVVAGGLARLTATDAFLAYVRPGMRIPLAASVVALAVLALSRANAADRSGDEGATARGEAADHAHPLDHGRADHGDDGCSQEAPIGPHDHAGSGHDHSRAPRIGWLLVVPVICIAIVPLRPLGSDAVSERSANVVAAGRTGASDPEDEIPTGGTVKVLDFVTRVINDPKRPYTRPVTLTGFVVAKPVVTDGFVIARFVMSCCAADAQPVLVHVVTDAKPPPSDSWVTVVGRQDTTTSRLPPEQRALTENIRLTATKVTRVGEPTEPYEAF